MKPQDVFDIKIRLSEKHRKTFNQFKSSGISISKLINELLDEVDNNKSFKFMILKRLENKYK